MLARYLQAFFIYLLCAGLIACPAAALAPGDSMPELRLPDVRGAQISLSEFKGKILLVDFWASWCAACKKSLPWLARLQNQFSGAGLQVITINLDQEMDDARGKLRVSPPNNLLVLYDPAGKTAERCKVQAMPSTYIIDRQGLVRHVISGFHESQTEEVEAYIQSLL